MNLDEQISLAKSHAATVRGRCDEEIRRGRMTPHAKDDAVEKWNEIVRSLERLRRIDEMNN